MLETAEIKRMSVAERLQAMEQLWDALSEDSNQISSPQWHAEVLAARKTKVERGELKFLTLEQLRARLRASQS